MATNQPKVEGDRLDHKGSRMMTARRFLLLSIGLSLAMIAAQIVLYPQVLGMPGGAAAVLQPVVLLLLCLPLVAWATADGSPARRAALHTGTAVGLACGVLEIVHIAVEGFANLSARAETISTGFFTLGVLLLWGSAGFLAVRHPRAPGPGWLAGGWSGVVGMLMVVTYGFSQLYWALPRLEHKNVGSPDLIRSGWTDLRAFTIADLFEAGFKVLFIGPLLGAALGSLGGLGARLLTQDRRALAQSER
jgi:hypothetical protein